ncbi:hypothetical protein Fmac_000523 [Flemingia macrophylla]|uniref:Neprosin PEP catalytic domain-containing protein n=1 Tax=Flemingia macrophylla TaxID=520843 RepID=A0ABD1NF56_9FABA
MEKKYQSRMGKSKVAIMSLLWVLFGLCISPHLNAEARTSSPLEREIEAKLKQLNKPAVKTIKSEDGDIIDCVNIYEQPAFDHPALKNHTIKEWNVQMMPDFLLESENSSTGKIFQTWQKSGSCPKGTIPIRRILKEDLLRAASLERFGRKPPALFNNSTTLNFSIPNAGNSLFIPENRSSSYLVTLGYNYIGAQADINVWNPQVKMPDDFTTAQIWLKNSNNPYFESVESGWMVETSIAGWLILCMQLQRDSYRSTGCFDLTCSGFIQTGQVVLGGSIGPISSPLGPQYEINVGIFLEPDSGNWYLKLNKNMGVGYWPAEILGSLRQSAILVEWGGQVSSTNIKKESPHTGTTMGSGDFAGGRYANACYMRNVRIKDYSLQLKYPDPVTAMADEPYCYSSLNEVKYGLEPVFYFGGPGRNPPYCP